MSESSFAQLVPTEEIARRIADFQRRLATAELDAALIVQTADLYYLTGTTQSAHLIVPREGEPMLLVRRTLERARIESPLERIEPIGSLRELTPALARVGVSSGRVGLELDVLPAAMYLDYGRRLEGYELADCSPALREARAVKSPWELECIRAAAAMISGIDEQMREIFRLGMTELELAAEVEYWLRSAGHQGQLRMRSFNGDLHYGTITAGPASALPGGTDSPLVGLGVNPYVGKGPSHQPITEGMPIVVDLVGSDRGYIADQTRCFAVGSVSERLAGAYERSVEIVHAVSKAARPGRTGSELYELALEMCSELGSASATGTRVSFVAHGFGLELDEPPFLARGWDYPLEAGMVFALEPKFVFPEGAIGLENAYAVTDSGVECLTSAPEELIAL